MNLHRSSSQPEWANLELAERNSWQSMAAATVGIITPGNIITVVGFGIVIVALVAILSHHNLIGLVGLIVGRGFDLLDGMAAEATGTKSPLGEAFDATFDKLGTAATLIVYAVIGFPWWLLLGLALPHLIISVLALRADRSGRRLHPSPVGKYSMAVAWLALLGVAVVPAFGGSSTRGWTFGVLALGMVASILMGAYAAFGYATKPD